MIDYVFLENCIKNAATLSDEDCSKCKRMLQAFVSDNDWKRLKNFAYELTKQAGTLAVYRFCKIINADDTVLFNELFSYWLSGDGRGNFSPKEELHPCFLDFFNSCKDRIVLQKTIDIIGANNSSYSRWIEVIRKQIKFLEENAIRMNVQQEVVKSN